jgi:glycogenin glucosyltransferase
MIYSTFVMKNDHFIPGALLFAYGLKKQGIKEPIYCFITEEVSNHAKDFLKILFDEVILIKSKKIKDSNIKKRDDRAYLFTRFELFKYASEHKLGKLLISDSDILPLTDYEELKNVQTPSAIINEKKEYATPIMNNTYHIKEETLKSGTWLWHEIYRDYLNGEVLPKSLTDKVLEDPSNLGMNTALLIVDPTMKAYEAIQDDLEHLDVLNLIKSYPWPEMQYLTTKWSGLWHTIDIKYASFSGYPRIDLIKGIHYAGIKPWAIQQKSFNHYSKFIDFRVWHHLFLEMLEEYPNLMEYPKLVRLQDVFTKLFIDKPLTQEEADLLPNWSGSAFK